MCILSGGYKSEVVSSPLHRRLRSCGGEAEEGNYVKWFVQLRSEDLQCQQPVMYDANSQKRPPVSEPEYECCEDGHGSQTSSITTSVLRRAMTIYQRRPML
jgi:hypothetical protein